MAHQALISFTMNLIEVEVTVNAPLEHVWNCFNQSQHIVGWNFAADSWHCPKAEADFVVGGKFCNTMAAKDGSFSFDFWGHYRAIEPMSHVAFSLGEDLGESRYVEVDFLEVEGGVRVVERFVPETQNPEDMQRGGWQAILENFKSYCEG